MEKVQARAGVVVLLGLLLLAGLHQEADAQGFSIPMSLDSSTAAAGGISCKALGNCEKEGADSPPVKANEYTRGCNPIHQCRD